MKQEFPPLLPLGFHEMTIVEMRVALVSKFLGSKRRQSVMDGVEKVLDKLITEKIETEVWIDGSFLTKKTDPDDSDILVLIEGGFYEAASPAQQATIDWLGTDLKSSHLCHAFVHIKRPVGHSEYNESLWWHAYWLRQFGFNRKDEPKGIVTIKTP